MVGGLTERRKQTYMSTGVKAFCAIACVKEEGLVSLHEAELIPETLDLGS